MSSWLEDSAQTSTEPKTEDIWLKIAEPPAVGKTTEVLVRILDEEPVGVWRHWMGKRPYNCPGIEKCPVCRVRNEAAKTDPEDYKNMYRLDYRYYFNVLHNHAVQMLSITASVGRKLQVFQQKYGDLRDYDISVRKRKTGPLAQNIEYDVIYEKTFALAGDDAVVAETRHDRSQFIIPTDIDTLKQIAQGQDPLAADATSTNPGHQHSRSNKATQADMIMLKTLIERNNYSLGDFGIVEATPPQRDVVLKLIEELRTEKH